MSENRRLSKRNYIGLACTLHDSAVAVVDHQGKVRFAEATERHLQYKRGFACIPDDPVWIRRVLDQYVDADADLVVATNWSSRSLLLARMYDRARGVVRALLPERHTLGGFLDLTRFVVRVQLGLARSAIEPLRHAWRYPDSPLAGNQRRVEVRRLNHHLTHAAAGCFTSPFDEAVCAVIDAYGENSSTGFFHYRDGQLRRLPRSKSPAASLGWFYALVCVACGFDWVEGEEWKVMGLAPYGNFNQQMYDRLSAMLHVEGLKICRRGMVLDKFWNEDHRPHAADLAHTGQIVFEQCLEKLLTNLAGLGLSDNLVYMGGCALNSSANGLILARTPFKRLHVYSAPADDGTALGAAMLAWRQDHQLPPPSREPMTPWLGSTLSTEVMDNVQRFSGPSMAVRDCGEQVVEEAARLLAEGKIIGWVQGRAEFGPRALGNRSILANPRDPAIKDQINARVKFREEFRPFAPSILHEYGPEYFEDYQESPYMERTLRFRAEVVDRVPGVVHVNCTGRLQTVKREWNERYYRLIDEFRKLTGIPLLLNTSFNVMGKPIVHSVEDAVAVFGTTGLDALVLGNVLLEKRTK